MWAQLSHVISLWAGTLGMKMRLRNMCTGFAWGPQRYCGVLQAQISQASQTKVKSSRQAWQQASLLHVIWTLFLWAAQDKSHNRLDSSELTTMEQMLLLSFRCWLQCHVHFSKSSWQLQSQYWHCKKDACSLTESKPSIRHGGLNRGGPDPVDCQEAVHYLLFLTPHRYLSLRLLDPVNSHSAMSS